MLNMNKQGGKEGEGEHGAFYLDPYTAQTKLAGVTRKIYKTVRSFCMLAFSVRKIDDFIMLPHCVHVWVYSTVCQSSAVCDMFRETILAIDGAL